MRIGSLGVAATLMALLAGLGATTPASGEPVAAGPSNQVAWMASAAGLASAAGVASASAGHTLPEAIDPHSRVRQLITVSSPDWSATTGTLRAWRRPAGGEWVLVHGPVSVVLGYSGWVRAADRKQSTGTTPAGVFSLPSAFGRLADPGAGLVYRQFDGNDWWPYEPRDPATYNVYQFHKAASTRWRADYSEHLADYPDQYAYAIVVGFNLPSGVHYSAVRDQRVARDRADTSRGGGIFLHVADDGLTAGCVAMPRSDVRWLIRWLNPQRHPRVAMGPHDYLVTR